MRFSSCVRIVAIWSILIGAASARAQVNASIEKVVKLTPNETIAAVSAWPKQMSTRARMTMLPLEVLSAAGLEQLGVDPLQIERLDALVGMPGPAGPQFGMIVQFAQEFSVEQINPQLLDANGPQTEGNFTFLSDQSGQLAIHQLDPTTVLVGTKIFVKQMVATRQSPGKIGSLLQSVKAQQDLSAIVSVSMLRPLLEGLLDQPLRQLPPPLSQEIATVVQATDFVALGVNLEKAEKITLVVSGEDELGAGRIEKSINSLLQTSQQIFVSEFKNQFQSATPTAAATRQYIDRISADLSGRLTPVRRGKALVLEFDEIQNVGVIGIAAGLLLPAVQSAREAARRMQSSNNLKQLALAMHNFHDAYKAFPATAGLDDNGKPLLSWRVAILPFIEQSALYEKFHLDEPWDSEHNIRLLELMPATYAHPSRPTQPGYTVYQAPVSDHSLLRETEPTRMQQITDGTSNTIMLIETATEKSVPWTKPEDYPINADDPTINLFTNGITQAAFGDGSVRVLSQSIDIAILKALFTRDGGEITPNF